MKHQELEQKERNVGKQHKISIMTSSQPHTHTIQHYFLPKQLNSTYRHYIRTTYKLRITGACPRNMNDSNGAVMIVINGANGYLGSLHVVVAPLTPATVAGFTDVGPRKPSSRECE